MSVNVYTRETVNGKRKPYKKINRKKIYPEGTVFTLGFTDPATKKWKWQTLPMPERPTANSMNLVLAAALEKEASFLTPAPSPSTVVPIRLPIDGMIEAWLDRIYKTRALSTYNAYRVAVQNFRKTCTTKEFLDELVLRDCGDRIHDPTETLVATGDGLLGHGCRGHLDRGRRSTDTFRRSHHDIHQACSWKTDEETEQRARIASRVWSRQFTDLHS
jgi:hypothetical protein